jgi:hypothetical protein
MFTRFSIRDDRGERSNDDKIDEVGCLAEKAEGEDGESHELKGIRERPNWQ